MPQLRDAAIYESVERAGAATGREKVLLLTDKVQSHSLLLGERRRAALSRYATARYWPIGRLKTHGFLKGKVTPVVSAMPIGTCHRVDGYKKVP